MATILIADDEKHIVQLVRLYLTREGYDVLTAANGTETLEKIKQHRPTLVLLDLMMPQIDGWEVCRQVRRWSNIPIIMLTARGDDVEKVVGLELGADDYITKPFNPRELVARVKALIRRSQATESTTVVLDVGNLRIDVARREVSVDGRRINLRPKEFDLLATFARDPGVVFGRDKLLSHVWGYEYPGETRTVDVHITWLRDKLTGSTAQIQTVWGVGYKLVVEPVAKPVANEAATERHDVR